MIPVQDRKALHRTPLSFGMPEPIPAAPTLGGELGSRPLCPQNLPECANGRFCKTARRWN